MTEHQVWDRFVRIFHVTLAVGFVANATSTEDIPLLHSWIGYGLGILVLARILWGLIGPGHARFGTFIAGPARIKAHLNEIKSHGDNTQLGHSPLGALMVLNLLATILAICLTGIMLDVQSPANWIASAHEALVGWATLSITVHVAAVLWESLRTGTNLVMAMITGRKRVPDHINLLE